MLLLLAAPLLSTNASAFCGTFVGAPGANLYNKASQVILAREGENTTLTLVADYQGDLTEFGLLIPVPSVVTDDDVALVDSAVVNRVAEWSTPRMVAYTCDDVVSVERSAGCPGDFMVQEYALSKVDGGGESADSSVTVEASFSEGEYDIVVLSAEESGDLLGWLDDNGYAVPEGGEAILQEYIDAGVYFLAARVSLEALPDGRNWLSPLQISYAEPSWSLPIRIGTTASGGEAQEVIVYALSMEGEVAISNYPQVTVDDECMLREGDDFTTAYADALDEAFDGKAGWIQEYSWSLTTKCDPCTSAQGLTPEELESLGFPSYHGRFTRLRVRYTPEQATQDLALYTSNINEDAQIRYIRYEEDLEFLFPVCGEGMVDDPGTCLAAQRVPVIGCAGAAPSGLGVGAAAAGVLAVAALRRRRA